MIGKLQSTIAGKDRTIAEKDEAISEERRMREALEKAYNSIQEYQRLCSMTPEEVLADVKAIGEMLAIADSIVDSIIDSIFSIV